MDGESRRGLRLWATVLALGALVALAAPAAARAALHGVKLGTFASPMYVAQAPGEPRLLFVVEQSGRIRLIENGATVAKPFLDIRDKVLAPGDDPGGYIERGLLSIAFPPDFQTSRRFYVYFTNNDGNIEIDQFRRSGKRPRRADPDSRRRVIAIPHPDFANHNGGTIQFGPRGLLFAATGDGGGVTQQMGRQARDLHSLLGKVIRIDPLPTGGGYRVPRGNPYVGIAGRDEIFAYGLRNPFRFSLDGARIAIGDVGQFEWEEVNLLPLSDAKGANFGWPRFEGNHVFGGPRGPDPPTFPMFEYSHSRGCAVIGGYVVRDPRLPSLKGRYLYGDHCDERLRSFVPHVDAQKATDDSPIGVNAPRLNGFGEGLGGQIYYAAGSGVFRLVETP